VDKAAQEGTVTAPIEEPLLESAPVAWGLAPQLCSKDPTTGERCSWYHGIWQFLRIMGLASSAAQRAGFYLRSIRMSCAGLAAPRILISGTADYAMLALVMASLQDRGSPPAVTVIDICETPLHLNRWYAERGSWRIETVCGNVLDFQAPEPFDVVCTDGFFSRVPVARRPALAAKWRELLRPSGRVIATNRLHPESKNEKTGFSPARAQAFREAVRSAMAEKRDAIRVDPQELMRQAEIYAARHDTYPLVSMEEIRGVFEETGFRIDLLSAVSRAREQQNETHGRETRQKSVAQMHLVASRL
jgi:2-polyprenyl-3-methyl-5-hydroxy-6-metoxy-1,4-benzoquinol methylase